ncbi:MAG: hypothetical protein GDA46_04585 [Bdellovibrionales bacterium]|nr:hypothetical protein [Bdellovibrionales bacterium]
MRDIVLTLRNWKIKKVQEEKFKKEIQKIKEYEATLLMCYGGNENGTKN